ncbi:MAG: HD domain-containing protein [Oscillospiraceae bacterium]
MFKAILSRKNLSDVDEYYSCVSDLLSSEEVLRLSEFRHHLVTNRFQHSLNVSYYNFKLCKLFRLDAKSAARAGLLHDLFFYDRKEHIKEERSHAAEHAKIALQNASAMFPLNEVETDMIINHMWPMTTKLPRYGETYAIQLVDKFCAVAEVLASVLHITGQKFRTVHAMAVLAVLHLNLWH